MVKNRLVQQCAAISAKAELLSYLLTNLITYLLT